jgi:predicted nucleotidyltransferase
MKLLLLKIVTKKKKRNKLWLFNVLNKLHTGQNILSHMKKIISDITYKITII